MSMEIRTNCLHLASKEGGSLEQVIKRAAAYSLFIEGRSQKNEAQSPADVYASEEYITALNELTIERATHDVTKDDLSIARDACGKLDNMLKAERQERGNAAVILAEVEAIASARLRALDAGAERETKLRAQVALLEEKNRSLRLLVGSI